MTVSAATKYTEMPIIAEILERLDRDLSNHYAFHSAQHARDVLNEVILFSETESRTTREMELLAIAAAYHDAGFLEQAVENEPIGAQIAEEAMRADGGYTEDEIELVSRMINDTRLLSGESGLFQQSSHELSGYLLDADLSNFGREDFFEKLELLVEEKGGDRKIELQATLALMQNHKWCTKAAKTLREEKKQRNIELLKDLLK